jgi:hypothetical protein
MKRLPAWAAAFLCAVVILSGGAYLATAPTAVRANLLQAPTTTAPVSPTGSCSQSTAFFARIWALPATLDGTVGGTAGPTNHLAAYDNLICNLVTDGVFAVTDELYVLATDAATGSNRAVADLNLISSSCNLTEHGSPTFTANQGFTGGADSNTTVYLDTGCALSSLPHASQNNSHISAWTFTSLQVTSSMVGATDASLHGTFIVPWMAGTSQSIADVNGFQNGMTIYDGPNNSVGSTVATRNSAPSAQGFRNGAVLTVHTAAASTGVPTTNLYILSNNVNGSPLGSAYQVSAVSTGGYLNPTTAPAVSSSGGTTGTGLVPRLCTYLTAVHGSC